MSRKHHCFLTKPFKPYRFYFISVVSLIITGSWYSPAVYSDGWDPGTGAGNHSSIVNSRHNLTQSYLGDRAGIMNIARNQYVEVCVYCHTPHGANSKIDAPLWNRTINTSSYTIYDKPRTLNRPIGQPGPNSLTCLTCHDGTIAIDSIINMPGSGGFNAAQETVVNEGFLDAWQGAGVGNHWGLGPGTGGGNCTFCHNANEDFGAPNFTVFVIGTDLQNDHPIGILYPDEFIGGVDFKQPMLTTKGGGIGSMKVFDTNANGLADKDEARLYDSGEGPEVECASCHDPHGVPSAGEGSEFIPSFLRVSNGNANTGVGTPSGLCLTCHIK